MLPENFAAHFVPWTIGGEIVVAIRDVAAGHQGLGAVGEGVFDGVAVEVLAAIGAAGKAPADAVRRHGPGILDPEALVDLMDHQLDEDAAGGPHELVGMAGAELPEQFVLAARERAHEIAGVHAIGADELDVAHGAVANLLDQGLAGGGMPGTSARRRS